MSTYLHLIKLAFWMLPMQRWLTVLGLGAMMGLGVLLFPGTQLALNLSALGGVSAFAILLFLGGAFWRALSAQRVVRLAPHGRRRMLLAVAGIAATIALAWLAWQALFDLGLPPRWRTSAAIHRQLLVGVFAAATWWGMASFIASRSPLAILCVLASVIATRVIFWYIPGIPTLPQIWRQPWAIALPLLLWALFGAWYLRARRINPPGWLLPGGQSVFGAVAMTDAARTNLPRRAALERLLLGGTSVMRLLLQWSLVAGVLLLVLNLIGRTSEGDARSVAHVSFAALILCPVVVAALAASLVRRARALWLPSGFSRGELFGYIESTLLKLMLGMALVFSVFLLLLWYSQPWHPATTLPLMLSGLFIATLLIAGFVGARPGFWQGLVLIAVLTPIWLRAFIAPLFNLTPVGTWWALAAGLVAIVALRELARRRWLKEDLPRPSAAG